MDQKWGLKRTFQPGEATALGGLEEEKRTVLIEEFPIRGSAEMHGEEEGDYRDYRAVLAGKPGVGGTNFSMRTGTGQPSDWIIFQSGGNGVDGKKDVAQGGG